jgi:glycerol kinase
MIENSEDVEKLAAEVADNGGVYFVPAFSGLGAPYWDANARALIVGMTRGTTRAHVARAVIEAMAYQTADVVEAMQHDAGFELTELRVDGGATANATAMQFQADVLGVPVVRAQTQETTALGAAYLAGLQSGVWSGIDALETHRRVDRTFQPESTAQWRNGALARWHRAVERSRDWAAP